MSVTPAVDPGFNTIAAHYPSSPLNPLTSAVVSNRIMHPPPRALIAPAIILPSELIPTLPNCAFRVGLSNCHNGVYHWTLNTRIVQSVNEAARSYPWWPIGE